MKRAPITVPVHITAEEHERIAAFCEKVRITVAEYVTFAGIGVNVDDYEHDRENRAGLLKDIIQRFGGPTSAAPTRTVTLEFSEAAIALLEANRVHDGFASVEEFIRGSIRGTVGAFCEAMDSESHEMREAFARPGAAG